MVKLTTIPPQITRLTELSPDIDQLCQEAAADGFRFMEKLRDDWRSGVNRFDAPGEIFLGVFNNSKLMAVGGLNRDPYISSPHIGRLRHVYVLKAERFKGHATRLVQKLLGEGRSTFSCIRLFTDTEQGSAFYEAQGFKRVSSATASHELTMGSDLPLGAFRTHSIRPA